MFCKIILFGLLPLFLVPYLFVQCMLKLRAHNFIKRNGHWERISTTHLEREEGLLQAKIDYHNNATYKAFEFYIKVTVAIFGGLAFIVLNSATLRNTHLQLMIVFAGIIFTMITLLFCILIFVHQKSKIIRWKYGYEWHQPLLWNECWFWTMSITLMTLTNGILIPTLI